MYSSKDPSNAIQLPQHLEEGMYTMYDQIFESTYKVYTYICKHVIHVLKLGFIDDFLNKHTVCFVSESPIKLLTLNIFFADNMDNCFSNKMYKITS